MAGIAAANDGISISGNRLVPIPAITNQQRSLIFKEIKSQKKVLFGKVCETLTKEVQENAWKAIRDKCKENHGFDPCPSDKDWKYIRYELWANKKIYGSMYDCNGWDSNVKRGHALIMDNGRPNQGFNAAKKRFGYLGYTVCDNFNLTPGEMVRRFNKFVEEDVKEQDDSFVVVILTDKGFDSAKLGELLKCVRVDKLNGKPKLFFIEIFSALVDGHEDYDLIHDLPELDADVLVAYSSTPSKIRVREKKFILTLSSVLDNHGTRVQIPDIINILIEVRNEIGTSSKCVKSSLRKLFYFNDPTKRNQENTSSESSSRVFSEAYDINKPQMKTAPLKGSTLFRGVALIINNMVFEDTKDLEDGRVGSDVDRRRIEQKFLTFGYTTFIRENLTKQEMINTLETYKNLEIHKKADSAIVVIMSHGEFHKITSFDGECVDLDILWNKLKSDQCKSLMGKPKLFFIQACRNHSNTQPQCATEVALEKEIPGEDHFLIAYASSPGKIAFRYEHGSPFIQSLNNIFRRVANPPDIESLLTKVNNHAGVLERDQVSQYCSSLTKLFYLNNQDNKG